MQYPNVYVATGFKKWGMTSSHVAARIITDKILGKENVRNGFYGQEKNITTYNLARINMFLHDINYNSYYVCNYIIIISYFLIININHFIFN